MIKPLLDPRVHELLPLHLISALAFSDDAFPEKLPVFPSGVFSSRQEDTDGRKSTAHHLHSPSCRRRRMACNSLHSAQQTQESANLVSQAQDQPHAMLLRALEHEVLEEYL